jgi:uncharacterized protein (TIGR03437 family)
MFTAVASLSLTTLSDRLVAQVPTFSGVVNPASDLPPGVPNYGIAQGSIFIVYGTNLSTGSLVQGIIPLGTSLNGTALTISQDNGVTVTAIPVLYTSPVQVAAIMPSNAPLGNVTLTVANGTKNASIQVLVVQSAYGISTVDNSGNGAAIVTFPDFSLVTTSKSAKPGDTLIAWGTGLGSLPAGSSDAAGAPFGNLSAQIQFLVGGIPATVNYHGRTPSSVGLDQINFVVPSNAPLGCKVSVMVQTSSPVATTSNGPTMPIATTNGVCSDVLQNIPQSSLTSLLAKTAVKTVAVTSKQSTTYSFPQAGGGPVATGSSSAGASFFSFTPGQLGTQALGLDQTSSLNSCFSAVVHGGANGVSGIPIATGLDGGATVSLAPPAGSPFTLSSVGIGSYQTSLANLISGNYVFSSPGGASVSALSFTFPIPQQIAWTNLNQILSGGAIDRTKPLTVTWSGGDATGYVEIYGQAQIGPQTTPVYTVYFDCTAPTSANSLTIPTAILAAMPTGAAAFGSIAVNTNAYPAGLGSQTGFDLSLDLTQYQVIVPVVYK